MSVRQKYFPSIIDIEASGFGASSYPIEIGVALNNGEKFCCLVKPAPQWTFWDEAAEKVHNISRDMLEQHGKSVEEVAACLNEMLAGMTLYSDGWVVDKPWLTTLFFAAGKQMQFSVSPLEMLLSESQMAVWHDTKDRILSEADITRHRASNDAWIIQETYRQTMRT